MAHMPLPICARPDETARQADVDVRKLVRGDPGLALHFGLAHHRAGLHRRVDLVAGAIEKPGVDEGHARFSGADAFLQVDGRATFLVHDADLHGVARQAKHLLDVREDLIRERYFIGTVHLRLHDVDGALRRISQPVRAAQVVHRDQDGAHRVEQALVGFLAVAIEHGGVGHQVADIAHQHQCAAIDAVAGSVRRDVLTVRVQAALEWCYQPWRRIRRACRA